MADVVVMPQLGNTVESCLVTSWHVQVGDVVDAATVVADIETDKSTMEVPAGRAGVILALLANAGDEVAVKAPFFVVGEPGESLPEETSVHTPVPETSDTTPGDDQSQSEILTTPAHAEEPTDTPGSASESGQVVGAMSPRARRLLDESGASVAGVVGTGPHGRVIAADVEAALALARDAIASATQDPDLANQGVTPQEAETPVEASDGNEAGEQSPCCSSAPLLGTGIGGRVTRQDKEAWHGCAEADNQPVPASAHESAPPVADQEFPGSYTETPLKGIRALVSDRMLASMSSHAQLSFDSSASASALLALRARFKASDESLGLRSVTIGDLVAFAAVRCVVRFGTINSTLENRVLRSYDTVHLGLAVDTERGLLVPTIRCASQLSLTQFSAQSKQLASQAQSGKINPDLLAGATFTVTNLGAYGIESFTPILNSPQVAILGVNAITPRPVLTKEGGVGLEQRIGFSLTVDHAVVDGADAARYLQALTDYISNIDLMLLADGGSNG